MSVQELIDCLEALKQSKPSAAHLPVTVGFGIGSFDDDGNVQPCERDVEHYHLIVQPDKLRIEL